MSKSEAIFTESDIGLFRMDYNRYNLTIQQLKPVVLDHVGSKNKNMHIKTSNINKTIENIMVIDTVPNLFKYMENKLEAYERTCNERAIKNKIQE